jgi:hypothetical protein
MLEGMRASRLAPLVLAPVLYAACGSRTNLSCAKELTVTREIPSLYFVLDRSTSMKESGKWDAVRTAVAGLMKALGSRARFGAAEFPLPMAADGCDTGGEVMSLRRGDDSGVAVQAFLDATADAPDGGTPTAATLASLVPTLQGAPAPTFVVLATDGGPNCNDSLTCDVATCTANIDHVTADCNPGQLPNCCSSDIAGPQDCLDDAETVSAVQKLAAASLPLYVIGVPGSEAYSQVLDALAQAGGTARASEPRYYDVRTADATALAATLADVAQRVNASCYLDLAERPSNPQGLTIDVGGQVTIEWRYDVKTGILTLGGDACAAVQSGGAVHIVDLDECPTK